MKFFKGHGKKAKSVKAPEPRALEELQKEYQSLSAQAANAQYLVFVHSKQLDQINQRLLEVNQEADARNKLDADKPKEETPATQEEVSNVQA